MNAFEITRRRLVQAGALVALGGVRVALGQPSTAPQRSLIVIMLRGAMDGLSLVAPYTEPAYYTERPGIAIAKPGEADGLIALDGRFGLHPAFAPLMPYWQSQQLVFVHASGSPDPTRSHFDAQDYMESATPGRKTTPDGWMNRLAAVLAGPHATPATQRLQAVNLGPTLPRIFAGDAAVASLPAGNTGARSSLDRPDIAAAFTQLYAGDDRMSQVVREASATRGEIMGNLMSDDPKADAGALPLAGLPRDAARLGRLMSRDARIRLAFIPVGGWDTHANQGGANGQLANRFVLLAQSLDALAQSLGPARMAETNILVMSEFGRTVRQNGTGGTDHGHGNVAFVLGGGVKGGRVAGEWPGLDSPSRYEGRDLAVTTDFRDLIADVLEERMKLRDAQLAHVLLGMASRRRVGLFA